MKGLVEQPWVQRSVDEACERWLQGYEAWEAITWAISQDDMIGRALNETGTLRIIKSEGALYLGLPTVTVLWRIGEDSVIIEGARFEEPTILQAGRA